MIDLIPTQNEKALLEIVDFMEDIPHPVETLQLEDTESARQSNKQCDNCVIQGNQIKELTVENMQLKQRVKELLEMIENKGMQSQTGDLEVDPLSEPVAFATRSRKRRDRSRYDYRDTPVDSPLWHKTLLKRKKSNIQICEPEVNVVADEQVQKMIKKHDVVGKGKGKIDVHELVEERETISIMEGQAEEEAKKDAKNIEQLNKMRKQAIAYVKKQFKTLKKEKQDEDVAYLLNQLANLKLTMEIVWEEPPFALSVKSFLSGVNGDIFTNGEVIDTYCKIMFRGASSSGRPYTKSIYCSTFFRASIKSSRKFGLQQVIKTDKDREGFRYIFIPLCTENAHFHLLTVDTQAKTFKHLNSMSSGSKYKNDFEAAVKEFKQYSHEEITAIHPYLRRHHPFDNWAATTIECPQQEASADCGFFVMQYIRYLLYDMKIDFNQGDMKKIRMDVMVSILKDSFSKTLA